MGWKVFFAIVETCIFFAVGGGALRIGYIGRDDIERWSRFTFNVFAPCLIFSSIAGGLGRNELASLWIMPLAMEEKIRQGAKTSKVKRDQRSMSSRPI